MAFVEIELKDLNDLIEVLKHTAEVVQESEPELHSLLVETLDRVLGHLTSNQEACTEAREIEAILGFIGHGGFRGS